MKNIKYLIGFTAICTLLFPACSIIQQLLPKKSVDLTKLEKLVEMSKGPCYGRCPVYTLVVYDNGVVTYEGKQNTDRKGLFINQISDSALKALVSQLVAAKLDQFQDAYRGRIPDLQTVTITYYGGQYRKRIVGKDGRPQAVLDIQATLEDIANQEGWELKAAEASDLPNYIVDNQIRLQLKEDVDVNAWVRKYRRQQMRVIKSMSSSSNFWLLEFNADRNDPQEVLAIVQADLQVISAAFNRQSTR